MHWRSHEATQNDCESATKWRRSRMNFENAERCLDFGNISNKKLVVNFK
jgi:hypothetical protein